MDKNYVNDQLRKKASIFVKDDMSKLSSSEISNTIAGMMVIIDGNERAYEGLSNQKWFQRLWNGITGKNKASIEEMKKNRGLLSKYSVRILSEMNQLEEKHSDCLNDLYRTCSIIRYHIGLMQDDMYGMMTALNEKINSVDSYHMLLTNIQNNKYSEANHLYSLIEVVSKIDKRTALDEKKISQIWETMENCGFKCDEIVDFSGYCNALSMISKENEGHILILCKSLADVHKIMKYSYLFLEEYAFLSESDKRNNYAEISEMALRESGLKPESSFELGTLYREICESLYDFYNTEVSMEKKADSNDAVEPSVIEQSIDYRTDIKEFFRMDETVWIEAGEECARICYEDIKLDDNPYYLESEEYIVYGKGTVVYCINKNSLEKKEVLTTTGTAKEYIKSGKITALSHVVYYLVGNDLYYKNLDTLESKKISDLSQILTPGGSIQEISVRDNRDFICWINSDLVICNLEQERQVVKRIKVVPPDGGSHPKYFVRGEYVYYLEGYLNDDNCFRYSLNKCHIESGNISTCSSLFGKNSIGGKREYYDFIIEGMFGNYYYALYNYCGEKSRDCTEGYDCFVIDTETQKEQYFNISSKHLYQVEQYNNFLVYIDGDSSYSLTIHNLLNNKRKILRKNCGYNDKTTLIEKIYVGDVFLNHHPASYIRIGRWIFIEDQERYYPEIISI